MRVEPPGLRWPSPGAVSAVTSRGEGALLAVKLAEQAARFDAEEGAVVVVGAEGQLVLARTGHLARVQEVAERLLGDQREAADQLHGVGLVLVVERRGVG